MNERSVMRRLREAGTAQNRKVYARHGVGGDMFGVSYGNLKLIEKDVRRALGTETHGVGVELWETGNHDARILATRLVDARRLRSRELDRWVGGVGNYIVTSAFASLVSGSGLALSKSKKWSASPREFVGQAGWNVLTELLLGPEADELDDAFLCDRMTTIECGIGSARNRVRYAMNGTLIALGLRSKEWEKRAIAAARRIGTVEVDHGETGCKTPDAARAIRKAARQRAELAKRRAQRARQTKKRT